MDNLEKARYIIEQNIFMVLATADAVGKPWVSPVGFVSDDDYNFYWISNKDALHSQNINGRPQVAITIFGKLPPGGFDGVYIDAEASELNDEAKIQAGIDLFKTKRPQPPKFAAQSPSDVMGTAAWRLYKATPLEISKRVDSIVNGQAITVREVIQL